jgi:phosphatidylserine/phosphatidylglycerophosphate/cardiolipin synthase-like enzyme
MRAVPARCLGSLLLLAASTACGSGGHASSASGGASAGGGGTSLPSSSSTTTSASSGAGGASSGSGGAATGGGTPESGIRIIVEPDGQNGAQLVQAILGAQLSVHMTMYMLSDDATINALTSQKYAGREVEVVLNENLPSGSNETAYSKLQSAGVDVRWSSSEFTYTHEKCVILDAKEAWIMTMNADYSAPRYNREYLAIDDLPGDVAEAEAVFEGDFAGSPPSSVSGPLLVAPINAHAQLVSLAASAHATIDIEAEELSDDAFVSALTTAAAAGVAVRVVLSDMSRDSAQNSALSKLKGAGVQVVQLSSPYVHAKSMVVDGVTAYVGSENFSYGSLEDNRELGVVFAIPSEVAKVVAATSQDFAAGTPL